MALDICLGGRQTEAVHVPLDELQVLLLATRGSRSRASATPPTFWPLKDCGKALVHGPNNEDRPTGEAQRYLIGRRLQQLGHYEPGELIGELRDVQWDVNLIHDALAPLSLRSLNGLSSQTVGRRITHIESTPLACTLQSGRTQGTTQGAALMKRTTKYVALDVHQASTVMSVRDQSGRVIARGVLPTEGTALEEFFGGMRGSVHVAFEEGRRTGSQPGRSPPLTITLIERLGFDLPEQNADPERELQGECSEPGSLPGQVQTLVIENVGTVTPDWSHFSHP